MKKIIFILTLILTLVFCMPLDYSGTLYAKNGEHTPTLMVNGSRENQIIVQYYDEIKSLKSFPDLIKAKIKSQKKINSSIELLEINNDDDIPVVIEELKKDKSVKYAEKNKIIKTHGSPNDPEFSKQWSLSNISAVEGWSKVPSAKKSAVVAVIDSGIDSSHPDLQNRISEGGYNFAGNTTNVYDDVGHGTMVAGVIAAEANNSIGIAGVAGLIDIKILPIKAIVPDAEAGGVGTLADLISSLNYAISKQVDIINLSLGSNEYSSIENDVIQRAINSGITVVASSGNDSSSIYNYPASYSNVISVGAINVSNTRASFSNYNDKVSVVAPGQNIYTTTPGSSYSYVNGTSFSAPIVSGIAAILKAVEPSLTPQQIKGLIEGSALDLGSQGKDIYYGWGGANLLKAINKFVDMYGAKPEVFASPKGGLYRLPQAVALTASENAVIHYTKDGSIPDLNSTVYSTSIILSTNTELKFMAVGANGAQSEVVTEVYYIDSPAAAAPRANPDSGLITPETEVILTSPVEGGTIYYTLDNTAPDISSKVYTAPIAISNDTVIKCIVVKDGAVSPVAVFEYKVSNISTIVSIVTKNMTTGIVYEYNYFDLRRDFINQQDNKPSLLLDHYLNNTVVALKDKNIKYIDYTAIRNASIEAQTGGEQFNLELYLQGSYLQPYEMPGHFKRVFLYKGAIVEDDAAAALLY